MFGPETSVLLVNYLIGFGLLLLIGIGCLLWMLFGERS